ncbi:uncharacterized protein BDW47DRAFT_130616 [Aspergillus candidus]|uniref:Uncharacterized protein n=1 Tax=Aspergillus candidus TaxID=41067 RepID=A0A2I2FGR2_ASPCN|nr:hypothetical protein BDW47DRAFT_130616 [Aspergillus candidus]PLB39790.1 hypothetical protein BDW47DRAFT_130616 [Aspergillus candidus]
MGADTFSPIFSGASEEPEVRRERDIHHRVHHQYNGTRGVVGWLSHYRYRKPLATDEAIDLRIRELSRVEEGITPDFRGEFRKLDGELIEKELDLDVYYSTTRKRPRRLLVQVTEETLRKYPTRHWRYRKVKGRVPIVMRLTELCLNPLFELAPPKERHLAKRIAGWAVSPICTIFLGFVIQLMMASELMLAPWSDNEEPDSGDYEDIEHYHWEWPKHATNILDQRPVAPDLQKEDREFEVAMLRFPRRLMVCDSETKDWAVQKAVDLRKPSTGALPRYIFMSYSPSCFPNVPNIKEYINEAGKAMIAHENLSRGEGEQIEAFWTDRSCIPCEQPKHEYTEDVNSICDAVRHAERVYIVLPEDTIEAKQRWGNRVWTLPEALLAADKMRYCVPGCDADFICPESHLTLLQVYETFWERQESENAVANSEIGLLVEHFSGTLSLSNIQLFAYATQAISRREVSLQFDKPTQTKALTRVDVALATMGLLAYRIPTDPNDNNFQAMARLSLANDSDQLLERLVCLLPNPASRTAPYARAHPDQVRALNKDCPVACSEELLNMATEDQFGSRLWDITPTCKLVGVGDDPHIPTVILDECRATRIRWKRFPQMRYSSQIKTIRGVLATKVVLWGCFWLHQALAAFWIAIPLSIALFHEELGQALRDIPQDYRQVVKYTIQALGSPFITFYLVGIAIYVGIAWVLSLFAPAAINHISRSSDPGLKGQLVGFEGTMDLRHLERLIFGNVQDRLIYTPSCTPLTRDFRDPKFREAKELDFAAMEALLRPGERLFSIVDMGTLSVTIIAAERPPTVALICGRDAGMLRALLCSWRFEDNCLYKETVMRMRSSMYDRTTAQDWVKVSLASQGAAARAYLGTVS